MKNKLEEIRNARGIKQDELAKVLEVSRQTISSLENGKYNPSIILAFKIARYFNMTIEEIFIMRRNEIMLCKFGKTNKKVLSGMVIFGVVSLIFGIVFANSLSDDQRSLMMLAGMFSGAGTGIIAVAIFFWIRGKVLSPEKLKQKAIEKNDERNVQITRTALTVVAITSNLTFAVLAFVLMGMGYMVPALIMVGCIYLQLGIFLIANNVISRKM